MAVKTESARLGDGLKWDSGDYSRENITVASGNSVVELEVVGIVTASGEYAPLDPAASDGTEAAAGFMVCDVDASSAAAPGAVVNDQALVVFDNLVWPDGITTGEKDTAIAELEALGIKGVVQA